METGFEDMLSLMRRIAALWSRDPGPSAKGRLVAGRDLVGQFPANELIPTASDFLTEVAYA